MQSTVESASTIVVAGVAGSGKSTLGKALARRLRRPLLDLDTATNPLLERLEGPQWNTAGPRTELIRDGRYAALRSIARELIDLDQSPILVAPFTRELAGGDDWNALTELGDIAVVYVDGSPELLHCRRTARGESRDAHRAPDAPAPVPTVPHLRVDATLSTDQQLFRVLRHLGIVAPIDRGNDIFAATFDAVMFDLDGTLVDSTAAVHRSWDRLAREFGFDLDAIGHGMPAAASLALVLDPDRAAAALVRMTELETTDVSDIVPIPGAIELLNSLPDTAKAVVTSGSPPIAHARMAAGGVPVPTRVVTSADITRGKPDPEPFLLGAAKLGVDPTRCLVIEDAPAGVTAAKAAGCTVLAVGGTSGPEGLDADLYVESLSPLRFEKAGDGYRLVL
ncbi:hypothetical protein GCM10007304_12430 [Rhodococcoides trifolii]|uniref:Sugar-phosphatase n=1 Tax=Rhodococcoides trifolii TaxID=908250 RepID=A0A917FSN5_9NOCA|nr:HAD-IA family hydrolase [Rhodococcus trifolii]GGG00002.1 hypothetical protein GCM10007304_12430 [Rhodococcus trifolii]